MTAPSEVISGLEGVVAAETRLSRVDGLGGRLIIGGYPVEDLAPNASFEEVAYLLWNGRLPTAAELEGFTAELAGQRGLPELTLRLLERAAATGTGSMDALRMAAASISLVEGVGEGDANRDARALLATFPTMVAAYHRYKQGEQPVEPRADLGHAANLLFMLEGAEPEPTRARALETYLNTVSDHGFNASTFTARVIISTRSDMVSALCGAIGALKGPLHGGAPGPALDMVHEIGSLDRAEPYIRAMLERGERLMGFGHRVYRVRDPRADVLAAASVKLYEELGETAFLELARGVEKVALDLLAEFKPHRKLQTNVEFYTALLMHGVRLETDLFTPIFAVGRCLGWTAHGFEQAAEDRLIRPTAKYVGAEDLRWVPPDQR